MPRRPIDVFWREQIRSITANSPKLGPGPLRHQLETVGARVGRTDWPSLRTIGRIQAEFRKAPEPARREYLEFRWPEAMERGDLPWEATRAALEALRTIHDGSHGLGPLLRPGRRPSIAFVRWLWRLTIADPDQPLAVRMIWALLLSRSGGTLPDARLAVEAGLVTGSGLHGERFFGELVDETMEFDIIGAKTGEGGQEDASEAVVRFTRVLTGEDLDKRELLAALVTAKGEKGESIWESEPTAKEASTSGEMGAGARRSRSKKQNGSTSSATRVRKSPSN